MRLFGLNISVGRQKAADDIAHFSEEAGGWWPVIREGYAGAWQQNITIKRETLLAFTPVFACTNRIVTDIGKMPIRLMEKTSQKIWAIVTRNSPYLPVVSKPNDYQIQSQFLAQWLISKLLAGNTYILKQRDSRGIVVKLFQLDPTRVRPLIAESGDVYYSLGEDPLSELFQGTVLVPASEIIHDRMPGMFHPLIGTPPIFACALPAAQGHSIQRTSAAFFKNMAMPSGILTAPGAISQPTADRLKNEWSTKFSGGNVGKVAVLGDGLKFEAMTVTSAAAQAVEQLKLSAQQVCTAFNVPSYLVGVDPQPATLDIPSLTQQYWSMCLQFHIEGIETGMTEGLGLPEAGLALETAVRLDIDNLLRMDTNARYEVYKNGISGGFLAPNEARLRENLPPLKGGDTAYMQQQNFSLEALARRDETQTPAAAGAGNGAPANTEPTASDDNGPSDDGEPTAEDSAKAIASHAKRVAIETLALTLQTSISDGEADLIVSSTREKARSKLKKIKDASESQRELA